ncbi:MAG: glycoside hydrolase family 36 protein [Chloroflexota bacterium]
MHPIIQSLTVTARQSRSDTDGRILSGAEIGITFPFTPKEYLIHGWQSWSLSAWVDPTRRFLSPRPTTLLPGQTDLVFAPEKRPHGSWLGAVDLPEGGILLLGALGLEGHVFLHENSFRGVYESGDGDWFLGAGDERIVFERYAQLLQRRFGKGRAAKEPRVWCSWYSFYKQINENRLLNVLADLGDLPFDVFQVDDGWQQGIGDWEPNMKFPSGMEALADTIKATGRTAGLWLAPLLVVPSSALYRQHPDWLLRDESGRFVSAGYNWGEPLFTLDTTHPAALEWLDDLMKKVRAWGYDYLKLDFLYSGSLPGKRYADMPREAAFRQGLQVIREALGDAYLLTCGTPILPSLGLCDGMRIGPDVSGVWESSRDSRMLANMATPGARNAIRTCLHRLWLKPLVQIDPDVVYFHSRQLSLTAQEKLLLQDLARLCEFKATSDLPAWLRQDEIESLRSFLQENPAITQTGRYQYVIGGRTVDFGPAAEMPTPLSGFEKVTAVFIRWVSDQHWILNLFGKLSDRAVEKAIQKNG